MPVIPTREICGLCHRPSPVGFHVPNEVWDEVVHPHYHESIHCLTCFIARADEKLVEWDRDITFYPVSLYSHLKAAREDLLVEPDRDWSGPEGDWCRRRDDRWIGTYDSAALIDRMERGVGA